LSETFDGLTQMDFLEATEKKGLKESLARLQEIAACFKQGAALKTFTVAEPTALHASGLLVEKFASTLPSTLPQASFERVTIQVFRISM